ncbi:OCIA domain-containing protein 1 [Phymastichus coffea]|uniref:OCIA domain-containing protein 1 n=1 Tax=Phymastichus coffea TaxID=108790 RepID=UPI00273C3EB7|nr:OCIA domain-containing protein 1 [Phymastichus coffea]
MNYSPVDNIHELPEQRTNQKFEPLVLTPEEIRVLEDCGREGVIKRAIPLGVIFGIGGMMGAKAGPLMSSKYGLKPAVIGLGVIGYFIGRISYSKLCFNRVLQVPDGNLRKFYDQKRSRGEYVDPAENYYATVEPKYEPNLSGQITNSDIDIPSINSFDTTPSDYYSENTDAPKDAPPQNYTSYDDLRRQNREEYSKKMYSDTVRRTYPQEAPVRRPPPPPPQAQPLEQPRGIKTKYGDIWDA